MTQKAHLTEVGLKKIFNIRASMNLGLSSIHKLNFPNNTPVERSLIITKEIPDPNWFAGFVSGEGCFFVNILKASTKIGKSVQLCFRLTQHVRDQMLIEIISKYLGAGKIYKNSNLNAVEFRIVKLEENKKIIIPFFNKISIIGVKKIDFQNFCKVANLMNKGKHLTTEGLTKIRKIKSSMNTGRKFKK
jgi:LAGLIDADG endonuclease